MPSPSSTDTHEIEQLDKFELRLALVHTSTQLESLLSTFLVPLLTKLHSEHSTIKDKVIGLLSHISTRIKSEPQLQLPILPLLQCLANPNSTTIIRHFAFVYIEIAFDRIHSSKDKAALLTHLLPTFVQLPSSFHSKLGVYILKCLPYLPYPPSLTQPVFTLESISKNDPTSHNWTPLFLYFIDILNQKQLPEGLDDVAQWNACKLNILLFTRHYLSSLQPELYWQKTLVFITGAYDIDTSLAEQAETALKLSSPDYEHPSFIPALLDIYLALKQNPNGKCKLITFLSKSKLAVNTFPKFVTVIYDALFSPATIPKLITSGITFIQWSAQATESTHFEKASPLLVAALFKLISRTFVPSPELTFAALGALLKRAPSHISNQILQQLFKRCQDNPSSELKLPLQSCLSTILSVMTTLPDSLQESLQTCIDHPSEVYRFIGLQFTSKLCPHEPFAIQLLLKSYDDPNLAIRQETETILLSQTHAFQLPWSQLLTTIQTMSTHLSPNSLKASIDYLFHHLLTQVNYKRSEFLPDHYLRDFQLCQCIQTWIQSSWNLATQFIDFLIECTARKDVTQLLQTTAFSLLYFFMSLGGAPSPSLSISSTLIDLFFNTHSFQFKLWLLPLLELKKSQLSESSNPSVEHTASNLLLFSTGLDSLLTSKELPNSPLFLHCFLFLLQHYFTLQVHPFSLTSSWIQSFLFPLLHHSSVDLVIATLTTLGTMSRLHPLLKPKLLHLLTNDFPKFDNAKKFHSVKLAAAECLCYSALGRKATCLPFHWYASDSVVLEEELDQEVIQGVLNMDTTVEPVRRVQLVYLEMFILHLPHLPPHVIETIHATALKAFMSILFADSASQLLMHLHLKYPHLSPQLMPSVLRCMDVAPSTSSTSSSFLLFSSLVAVAKEIHQPSLACQLLQLTDFSSQDKSLTSTSSNFFLSPTSSSSSEATSLISSLPVKLLIPSLYRFQCHPNTSVAESICHLIQKLLTSSSLLPYVPDILAQLEKSLNHSSVFTREMALLGFLELTKRLDMSILAPSLTESFCKAALRLLDDTHPSIQSLAIRAGHCLCLHPNLDLVLTFLMEGLKSVSSSVSKFSQSMLFKLCGSPTSAQLPLLYPRIPSLVQSLLESLSSLEPQIFNYLSFHVQSYEVSPEQLDAQRLALLRDSPTMRAIEALLTHFAMAKKEVHELDHLLAQALAHVLRNGIGLPTRGAAAKCILMLPSVDISEEASTLLLKALSGTFMDPNLTLAQWMSTAAASIARKVPQDVLLKFLNHVRKVYLMHPSEKRIPVMYFFVATMKIPGIQDRIQSVLVEVVPLIALSKFSTSEKEKELAMEVWQHYVHGDANGVRLYEKELVPFLLDLLISSKDWTLQDQATQALTWMYDLHPFSLSTMDVEKVLTVAKTAKREPLLLLALHLILRSPLNDTFLDTWLLMCSTPSSLTSLPSFSNHQSCLLNLCFQLPFHPKLVQVLATFLPLPTPEFWNWYTFSSPFEETVTCLLSFSPFSLEVLKQCPFTSLFHSGFTPFIQSMLQVFEKAIKADATSNIKTWIKEHLTLSLESISDTNTKASISMFLQNVSKSS